jgi:hypothetical protein
MRGSLPEGTTSVLSPGKHRRSLAACRRTCHAPQPAWFAQQVSEKAPKAPPIAEQRTYPYTHNLEYPSKEEYAQYRKVSVESLPTRSVDTPYSEMQNADAEDAYAAIQGKSKL